MDVTDWGWKSENIQLVPVMLNTEAVPTNLLKLIHCNYCAAPPPPHSEVGMTACVLPKCTVKGYFSCNKVRPENWKKRGVFDFSPGDFFKKGVFFLFLSSLWTPEKLFRI